MVFDNVDFDSRRSEMAKAIHLGVDVDLLLCIIEPTTIGKMIAQDEEVPHALPAAVETAEAEADSKNDKEVSPLPPVTPPDISDVNATDTNHHPSRGAASIDIEREASASESGSNDISAINNNKSFSSSIRGAIDRSARTKSRVIHRRKSQDRLAELDDEEGKSEFFLILLIESLDDEIPWFIKNTLLLTVWAVLCALFSSWLRDSALQNPGGQAEVWLEDIQNCNSAISILGTLFVFTLVFRFNSCYDRWWGE